MGEGPHDVGRPAASPQDASAAAGVVPALARRIVPGLSSESLAVRWTELPRFHPFAQKRGYEARVAAALLISQRKYRLDGTICVADQDRDKDRLAAMQAGRDRGLELVGAPHAAVCAVAVESIEAWTLGARSALASELRLDPRELRDKLPADVESLTEQSGKPEKRPKRLLAQLAEQAHRTDCADLRTRIAEQTDVEELASACRQGFAPSLQRCGRPSQRPCSACAPPPAPRVRPQGLCSIYGVGAGPGAGPSGPCGSAGERRQVRRTRDARSGLPLRRNRPMSRLAMPA